MFYSLSCLAGIPAQRLSLNRSVIQCICLIYISLCLFIGDSVPPSNFSFDYYDYDCLNELNSASWLMIIAHLNILTPTQAQKRVAMRLYIGPK